MAKKILNQQSQHWESSFSNKTEVFGNSPSSAAIEATSIFKKEGITDILELGAGQGRDTIFFAKSGFKVQAIDYSKSAIDSIKRKAKASGLSQLVSAKLYDLRKPLPFDNEVFNGCFSHMLYCMAFKKNELVALSKEVWRVLKPKGLNIYTARHTKDGDYKNGIYRGKDLYENDGFIVHFFSKKKIKELSRGFKIIKIRHFEEGKFPRKLYEVVLEKKI